MHLPIHEAGRLATSANPTFVAILELQKAGSTETLETQTSSTGESGDWLRLEAGAPIESN